VAPARPAAACLLGQPAGVAATQPAVKREAQRQRQRMTHHAEAGLSPRRSSARPTTGFARSWRRNGVRRMLRAVQLKLTAVDENNVEVLYKQLMN